jgi:hypothetical protein
MRTITRIVYNSFRDDALDLWLLLRLMFKSPKCKYCGTKMTPSKFECMLRDLLGSFSDRADFRWPTRWTCDECKAKLRAVPGKAKEWVEPMPANPDAN